MSRLADDELATRLVDLAQLLTGARPLEEALAHSADLAVHAAPGSAAVREGDSLELTGQRVVSSQLVAWDPDA